jgi:AraC-like DNA-binding protein
MRVPRELRLPSGLPALVVNLGAPFRVIDSDGGSSHHDDISFMGVHSRPFVTETSEVRDLLVANLTPLGARRVLGVAMNELTNRWVALRAVLGVKAGDLSGRLHEARSWDERFAILDRFMLGRLGDARAPPSHVGLAWRRMTTGGTVGVLARSLGVSHKHLIDQFHDQVGLAPKLVGRIGRFNRLLRLSGREARMDWAQAAEACGYFDQAHLINEVRDFAGETPTALRARRVAFTLRADVAG